MMREIALAAAFILCGASATTAQVGDTPPVWHYGCGMAVSKTECLDTERKTFALLRRFWNRLPLGERERCMAQAESTDRSYINLQGCLDAEIKQLSGGPDALKTYYRDIGVPRDF